MNTLAAWWSAATRKRPALCFEVSEAKNHFLRCADTSIDTEFSGTTFVVGVLRGNQLWVANIGDSRIILGKQTSKGIEEQEVSIDHKPDRPDEQKRIESCGGRVFAVEYDDGVDGPPRVWLGHMDIPGLAMSRSLGDSVAHTAGVISEPEITQTEVNDSHKVSGTYHKSGCLVEFACGQTSLCDLLQPRQLFAFWLPCQFWLPYLTSAACF